MAIASNTGKFLEDWANYAKDLGNNVKPPADSKLYEGIDSARRNMESMAGIKPGSHVGDTPSFGSILGRYDSMKNEAKRVKGDIDDDLTTHHSRLKKMENGNLTDTAEYKRTNDQVAELMRQRGQIQGDMLWQGAKTAGAAGKRLFNYALREGDMMDRAKKTAIIGGAWVGANTAMRGMTGGSYGHNNRGERDIAGIPFV